MTSTPAEVRRSAKGWVGHRLDALDGAGTGKVAGSLCDRAGEEWLLIRVGRFGRATAVPAAEAVEGAGCVWVPYPQALVRQAPNVRGSALEADDERRLREHYGLDESS